MSTPLAVTLRIEKVLRFIAAHPGTRVSEAAKAYKIPAPEIWQWLKDNNQSRPQISDALVTRVIDNAKRKQLEEADVAPLKPAGVAAAAQRPRIAPRPVGIIKSAELPAPPPAPAKIPLLTPTADLPSWLNAQKARTIDTLQTYVVEVTPGMAARWLTLNQGNRKPSRAKVRRFADVIKAGNWEINGETVKFSSTGRLLDGQSRLRAIIEANTPALLELRGGISDRAQQTMDAGESRRATHALEMLGYQDAHVLSPALRFVYQMEHGGIRAGGSVTGRQSVMENLAVPELIKRNGALTQSVTWAIAQGHRLRKLMPFSEAAFFHYAFAGAGTEARDLFFRELTSKTDGHPMNPITLLRHRLTANIGGKLASRARVKLIVKAWNAFAQKSPLAELTLTPRENCAPIFGSEEIIRAA